ncbi:MAG: hypothetical protein AAGF49_11630, partial [Pseudomonadota bacterium]
IPSQHPFAHGAIHRADQLFVADSYHPSRYNVNTGVLNAQMFATVMAGVRRLVDGDLTAADDEPARLRR